MAVLLQSGDLESRSKVVCLKLNFFNVFSVKNREFLRLLHNFISPYK